MSIPSTGPRALPRPIPERIKEAREARGFTLEAFASALEVSRQAIAQFETGQSAPSGETMAKIIALTSQPALFFTSPPPRLDTVGTPFWRSLKRMEQHHRRRIGRRLTWVADVCEYVTQFMEMPAPALPVLMFDPDSDDDEQIEVAAEAVRDYWQLGRGPIEDIVSLLEEHGIIVVRDAVECPDMDAVSWWANGRPTILYSSEVESGPRVIYNLAHELGHLVLHAGIEVTAANLSRIEKQANRFAASFLLPRETFSQEVLATSLGYFMSLKKRWQVSVAAMAYRCKDLELFTDSQFSYLMRQLTVRKQRKFELLDDVIQPSMPTVLKDAITLIMAHGVQTRAQIEQGVSLNLADVERLCGLEAGALDTRVVPFRPEPRFLK